MKKVLKFKFEDKEGFLSVIEKDHAYLALIQKDTPKVKEIEITNQLLISYELIQPSYQQVLVKTIFDQDIVKDVYEQLEKENNLYFKTLDDTLCVLEIAKEKS